MPSDFISLLSADLDLESPKSLYSKGQVGWDLEQPALVEDVPAHGKGWIEKLSVNQDTVVESVVSNKLNHQAVVVITDNEILSRTELRDKQINQPQGLMTEAWVF
ncbi:hypothetical protein TURU_153131 [Turdus rufiventris]|nr:hypothetical protein TURU_153131 [Turdus rufiventris]